MWRPKTDDPIAFLGHEPFLLNYLNVTPDDVFIDVGAHIGRYSIRLSKNCKKVIAIEPNPDNQKRLAKNMQLNDISNISVIPYAAMDKEQVVSMDMQGVSSRVLGARSRVGSASVAAYPLDKMIQDKVDLVKIDVEGMEMQVLEGSRSILSTYHPTLIVEVHGQYSVERERISRFLEDFGYSISDIGTWGNSSYILAKAKR